MRETLVDALLVEKAQAGERYAFDCLVVKYQRRLVQMVATMTFNMDDAEDVVQDSFIKAFRALSSFRGEASFYTWIFRITLNTAKNFLTTKRSRAIISMELTTNEDGTPVDHAPRGRKSVALGIVAKQTDGRSLERNAATHAHAAVDCPGAVRDRGPELSRDCRHDGHPNWHRSQQNFQGKGTDCRAPRSDNGLPTLPHHLKPGRPSSAP